MKSLLFHKIDNAGEDFYTINEEKFRDIINFILRSNFEIQSFKEYLNNKMNDDKKLIISFDDGYESDYTVALRYLTSVKSTATFFITVNFVGKKGYLTWEQIREISDLNMEIGSHSISHTALTKLTHKEVKIELEYSKKTIEDKVGKKVYGFSFPGGYYNKQIIDIALEDVGYAYVSTSEYFYNVKYKNGKMIFGRFPVYRNIDYKSLNEYINSNSIFYIKSKAIFLIKENLKKLIGQDFYVKLRNKLVR